jgi:hypothetical protein
MKIHLVGAELFHSTGRAHEQTDRRADRQTDMTKQFTTLRKGLKI